MKPDLTLRVSVADALRALFDIEHLDINCVADRATARRLAERLTAQHRPQQLVLEFLEDAA